MTRDICRIAQEAATLLLASEGAAAHEKGGHANFVTDADLAIEALLRERLVALLPESRFFGEESENAALDDVPTWIVDPIDGTLNFMRGMRASAISICLAEGRTPSLGVVLNPYSGECFTAVRGGGAYLNGAPIHISDTPFARALVGLGTAPYDADLAEPGLRAGLAFLRGAADLRRSGSAALDLADVARGRLDIAFELRLSPWDFAAGALLVTEAGGVFDMPWQAQPDFGVPGCVLACAPQCYQEARAIVASARPSGRNNL